MQGVYSRTHARYFIPDDALDEIAEPCAGNPDHGSDCCRGFVQPPRALPRTHSRKRQSVRPWPLPSPRRPATHAVGPERISLLNDKPGFTASISTDVHTMSAEVQNGVTHHEIANLAYLNWQKDGCPPGRDQAYWLEAEHQIKHTKHLLVTESRPQPGAPAIAASKPKTVRRKAKVAA